MKKLLLALVTTVVVSSAQAGLFSPETIGGGAIGAAAGALIGHGVGGHAGEGAAIGAGVGLLGGALLHESRVNHGYYGPTHYSSPSYGYYGGYYSHHWHRPYRYSYYWGPSYSYYSPAYVASYSEPVYASAPVVQEPVQQQAPAPQPQPQAQNVTIINNYYNSSSPMSSANSLFGR